MYIMQQIKFLICYLIKIFHNIKIRRQSLNQLGQFSKIMCKTFNFYFIFNNNLAK